MTLQHLKTLFVKYRNLLFIISSALMLIGLEGLAAGLLFAIIISNFIESENKIKFALHTLATVIIFILIYTGYSLYELHTLNL